MHGSRDAQTAYVNTDYRILILLLDDRGKGRLQGFKKKNHLGTKLVSLAYSEYIGVYTHRLSSTPTHVYVYIIM